MNTLLKTHTQSARTISAADRAAKRLPIAIALGFACAHGIATAQATYAYTDSNDTVLKKSGTASAKVSINSAWSGFSLSQSPTTTPLNTLSAISFDIHPGTATNVAKVAGLRLSLQNGSAQGNSVPTAA